MSSRTADLRRIVSVDQAMKRSGESAPGWNPPPGEAFRRSALARASLLQGGPSDARRKEEAFPRFWEAQELFETVESSPVKFDKHALVLVQPALGEARQLAAELWTEPASDDHRESDPRFAKFMKASSRLKQVLATALASGRNNRIEFIESSLSKATKVLEDVEPFDLDDLQDSDILALSNRHVFMHDAIEALLLGSPHSADDELVGQVTEAATLKVDARLLSSDTQRAHQRLAAMAHMAQLSLHGRAHRRVASPPGLSRSSYGIPAERARQDPRHNSLSKGHQHIPQLSSRQTYLHGISERELLGRYGYSRTADGRLPSTRC